MPNTPEHRRQSDRRRQPRGGRRTGDQWDFAPLVLLIGDEDGVRAMAEAVLAKLRFAVTTTPTVEEALTVVRGIRPEIVVATEPVADRVRREVSDPLAVVVMTEAMRQDPRTLIPAIRDALRAR